MAHMEVVWTEFDENLKTSAERLLEKIGVSPMEAIRLFYQEIVTRKGLPFKNGWRDEDAAAAEIKVEEFPEFLASSMKSVREETWGAPGRGTEMLNMLLELKRKRAAKKRLAKNKAAKKSAQATGAEISQKSR